MDECGKTIFESHCKSEFEKIGEKLDSLNHKLFIDNGHECIQSRLNRYGAFINRLIVIGGAIWAIAMALIVWILSKI